MQHPDAPPAFARDGINLAHPRLGAVVLTATDEFFAAKERMLDPEPAVFHPGRFDAHGKWMDGWETRRRRGGGHDVAVVRLGVPGVIRGFDIDTSHFTGNYPPAASIEGCRIENGDPGADADWAELLPAVSLGGNAHHYHSLSSGEYLTHLRVNLFPDGGLARLRVYGEVEPAVADADGRIDLAAALNGARAVAANNEHFGVAGNLLMPGRGVDMGDGWETRRRREPGFDWCIIALARPGVIEEIEVDTAHFKGNYPDRFSIEAALVSQATDLSLITQSMFWAPLLPEQPLQMDHQHHFREQILAHAAVSHVRLSIYPDGGISRLRLRGRPA